MALEACASAPLLATVLVKLKTEKFVFEFF
jgi:hypothetical protein